MINPTEEIRMTTSSYLPQFMWNTYKYYNPDFFVNVVRLKSMYENAYARKNYYPAIQPFKARIIQ